ncbi:MAG: methylated-DNA--[protein]-cysteine S-methyltransferase [Thermoplasmata archaeon]|nr:MAG: methylated-DNA--[protein]-cysteine S-methyltransferase [Thermoplasmata archaeon]
MDNKGLSFKTEFGWITVETIDDRIKRIYFSKRRLNDSSHLLIKIKSDLIRYFKGEEVDFRKYKVDLGQYTEFGRKVLAATKKLKYGETTSYGKLAKQIGHPNAQRAVGTTLSKNNIPFVIPCHRVLGSNGIGGFTPDLNAKRRLLALEKIRI